MDSLRVNREKEEREGGGGRREGRGDMITRERGNILEHSKEGWGEEEGVIEVEKGRNKVKHKALSHERLF